MSIARHWDHTLQVLFSGFLSPETGARIFIDALLTLKEEALDALSCFHFVVVGEGSLAPEIREVVANRLSAHVEYLGRVSDCQYHHLLRRSHIGLCLKMPDHSFGQTTFPSKVIEFAAWGLLVVSSRVSDVPLLFSEDSAYLLDEATPECLGRVLLEIARRRGDAKSRAEKGQATITERLNPHVVATELGNLWQAFPTREAASANRLELTR
jgi:glycosyltransferase involved in cell wall biosynthesis